MTPMLSVLMFRNRVHEATDRELADAREHLELAVHLNPERETQRTVALYRAALDYIVQEQEAREVLASVAKGTAPR